MPLTTRTYCIINQLGKNCQSAVFKRSSYDLVSQLQVASWFTFKIDLATGWPLTVVSSNRDCSINEKKNVSSNSCHLPFDDSLFKSNEQLPYGWKLTINIFLSFNRQALRETLAAIRRWRLPLTSNRLPSANFKDILVCWFAKPVCFEMHSPYHKICVDDRYRYR